MSNNLTLWRSQAPQSSASEDASEALRFQITRSLANASDLRGSDRQIVSREIAATMANIMSSYMQLEFHNLRRSVQLQQDIRLELARAEGQAQVLMARNEAWGRVVVHYLDTIASLSERMDEIMARAQQHLANPEALATMAVAFDRCRAVLVAMSSQIAHLESLGGLPNPSDPEVGG